MILHLGGVFGDKAATLDRFRENYKRLSQGIKDRLVLENDDVSWSVHDLLPVCEELNIPMVLDFHHHNIIFDADKIREGTKDIVEMYPRILATWERKQITPKMHYSEPTPSAITGRQRRKHSPRVAMLPPCPPTMDLMIEAKDKEQAVFELMRTFKLPGFDSFNDIIPHARKDDNKPIRTPKKKAPGKKPKKVKTEDEGEEDNLETPNDDKDPVQAVIADDDIGMGGPEGRVYWPPGMEHWLRPVKKVVKPKGPPAANSPEKAPATPTARKRKAAADASKAAVKLEDEIQQQNGTLTPTKNAKGPPTAIPEKKRKPPSKKTSKSVPTPSTSDDGDDDVIDDDGSSKPNKQKQPTKAPERPRRTRAKEISYAEDHQGDVAAAEEEE